MWNYEHNEILASYDLSLNFDTPSLDKNASKISLDLSNAKTDNVLLVFKLRKKNNTPYTRTKNHYRGFRRPTILEVLCVNKGNSKPENDITINDGFEVSNFSNPDIIEDNFYSSQYRYRGYSFNDLTQGSYELILFPTCDDYEIELIEVNIDGYICYLAPAI